MRFKEKLRSRLLLVSLSGVFLAASNGQIDGSANATMPRLWPGVACWPKIQIESLLSTKYGEVPVALGNASGRTVAIWASTAGNSYSIVTSWGDNNKYRCVVAQGRDLEIDMNRVKQLLIGGKGVKL